MDGHIAPLAEICALAKKYDALVFVDDCHATGFLGRTGRGTDEHCGVVGQVDIINSTLGKAMGGATGKNPCCTSGILTLTQSGESTRCTSTADKMWILPCGWASDCWTIQIIPAYQPI